MTQDSGGSERPQRTVAELLAEFGGNADGAPRRRRRRAEDDGDSAPQTIIERVLSDSGKLLPIREDEPQQPPRRPGGHRSERRQAQQGPRQAPPPGQPPTSYAEPVRPQQQQPTQQPQAPQNPRTRQLPPARAPQQQPQPQFPPSRPGMPPVAAPPTPPAAQQPTTTSRPVTPPQQASRPGFPTIKRTPPPTVRPPAMSRPPIDDESETAVHPALPADDFEYPPPVTAAPAPTVLTSPVSARLTPGLPPEATTEEFPPVTDEPVAPNNRATQLVPPVGPPGRRPGQQTHPGLESTQAHPYVDDDFDDDFPSPPTQAKDDAFGGGEYNADYGADPDDGPVGRLESFDEVEHDARPAGGREWFIMGAQVGAGAIAGAAVWLAFSWLWGFQPVVAVIAALAVIVGLVLGVRRWRRADDLQTTVLAILAGLVVTVSPAALLLLHR